MDTEIHDGKTAADLGDYLRRARKLTGDANLDAAELAYAADLQDCVHRSIAGADRWQQFGDACDRQGLFAVIRDEDGDLIQVGSDREQEALARALADVTMRAYAMAGHCRREQVRFEALAYDVWGPCWRELGQLARDARAEGVLR